MIDAYGNKWNKELICDYCKHIFKIKAEKGVTYKGIDEHHNPPKFMFEKYEKWKGKLYNLCRKHHRKLHDEIINILNLEAKMLKFIKSEYWVWMKMNLIQRGKARERVFKFTERWINKKEEEDDTKTIKEP